MDDNDFYSEEKHQTLAALKKALDDKNLGQLYDTFFEAAKVYHFSLITLTDYDRWTEDNQDVEELLSKIDDKLNPEVTSNTLDPFPSSVRTTPERMSTIEMIKEITSAIQKEASFQHDLRRFQSTLGTRKKKGSDAVASSSWIMDSMTLVDLSVIDKESRAFYEEDLELDGGYWVNATCHNRTTGDVVSFYAPLSLAISGKITPWLDTSKNRKMVDSAVPVDERMLRNVLLKIDEKKGYYDTSVRSVLESVKTIRRNIRGFVDRMSRLVNDASAIHTVELPPMVSSRSSVSVSEGSDGGSTERSDGGSTERSAEGSSVSEAESEVGRVIDPNPKITRARSANLANLRANVQAKLQAESPTPEGAKSDATSPQTQPRQSARAESPPTPTSPVPFPNMSSGGSTDYI